MTQGLAGRSVLVTGGTSGIGEATVRRLAEEGAQVAFCGRRSDPGRALEAELSGAGHRVLFLPCDVSQETEVVELLRRATEWAPGLDLAVNCAGISPRRAALVDSTIAVYEQVFATNVRGTFLTMKHEMRAFTPHGGVIVNIASVLGLRAFDLKHSLYTASKHAVLGLTKTAALEGASLGIRVNAVCPGGIDTPIHVTNTATSEAKQALANLHPLGRLGTPREVASAVLYFLSAEAGFATGSILSLDGGASV